MLTSPISPIRQILFSLIFCATATIAPSVVHAQNFQNLDFEILCDSFPTGLCGWGVSWGKAGALRPVAIDGGHALQIQGATAQSVGFAEQTSTIDTHAVQIVTCSGRIKVDSVIGKGAGLNLGLYDADDQLVTTKDAGGFYSLDWIKGSTGWKTTTIQAVCPVSAVTMKLGAILYGQGSAWFDDFAVQMTPIADRRPSPLARAYCTAALDTIMTHALVRDSLVREELLDVALHIAGPAATYAECHLAIGYMIESLRQFGDHHSFLMTPEEVRHWEGGDGETEVEYPAHALKDHCGYLALPGFHAGDSLLARAFADSLQQAIRDLYAEGIRGWIVDLRQNTGGNMEPMIAGLGPLFDSGELGFLVDVNQHAESWRYADGVYYWEDEPGLTVSDPVALPQRLPIAVLTSHQTGSSGEIVVLSFVGNTQTRSFGQATWGLTTGNGGYDLPDGARIMLSSTVMADRHGRAYYGPINPDVPIAVSATTTGDPVLQAAIEWIARQ